MIKERYYHFLVKLLLHYLIFSFLISRSKILPSLSCQYKCQIVNKMMTFIQINSI